MLIIAFTALSYFIVSCQHDLPVTCEQLNFSVATEAVDATNNQANGSITATATGGNGFFYTLNNGDTSSTGHFESLEPGDYTVTASNSLGCSATSSVTVGGTIDPCAGVNITISTTQTDPTIGQSNGSITATASPTGTYTYSLDGNPFQSNGTFNGLATGNHTIVAKNSNGCTSSTKTVTLGSVDPCAGVTITVSTTKVDPTTGQSNGSITATASPAGTYTYRLDGGAFQPSGTFSGLAAGNHIVVAKNSTGCTSDPVTVTLGSVDPCAGVTITVSTTKVDPTTGQSNGSITATASPAGSYTYSLDGGAFQASGTFSGLSAGNHTVIAKNSNGCISTPVTVTLNAVNPCAGVTISANATPTNPTNGANGSITVAASGGTAPYTYSLNGGTYGSNSTFSSLSSGAYTISVKDVNGCSISTPASVSLACPPVSVTGTPRSPNTNCTNGSIVVSATGGVSPYTYSNNGGAFGSSTTISSLGANTYNITAKDSKGCTGSNSIVVAAPTTVSFSTSIKPTINTYCGRSNISCHNHANSWTTYSDIVGTSTGTTWSSNLLAFIRQVRGTSGTTGTCPVQYSSGSHNMPPSSSTAWTTFIQGVFTNWVNQGYPNN